MPHFARPNTQLVLKTPIKSSLLHKIGCGSEKQINKFIDFSLALHNFSPPNFCTTQIKVVPLHYQNPPSLSTMLNRRQTESNVKLVWTLPRCEGGRDFLKLKCAGRFILCFNTWECLNNLFVDEYHEGQVHRPERVNRRTSPHDPAAQHSRRSLWQGGLPMQSHSPGILSEDFRASERNPAWCFG